MKFKNIKLNISHLVMGAIILLLLLVVFLRPKTVDSSKYDKQKQEIDSLNRTLIDLQKKQVELDNSILQHQFKIDSLNKQSYDYDLIILDECHSLLFSHDEYFTGSGLGEAKTVRELTLMNDDNFGEIKFNQSTIGTSTKKALEDASAKIVTRMVRKKIFSN